MSPYWEVASCSAVQEFANILSNPTVHSRDHISPPLFPILNHIYPIHITPFCLSKKPFNIVLQTTSRSFQSANSFWLSHQYPIRIPLRAHACYMPCPSHPPWRDRCNSSWDRVQLMKRLIMQFPPTSRHFIWLLSKYSPWHLVLKRSQSETMLHTHTKRQEIL
jgi:hypothetical protein